MFAYPAIFTPEPEGGFTVTFRDAPEAIAYGETEEKAASKAALARAVRCHLPLVDRLLDLCHQSRWAMIMRALTVLDKRLSVEIRDAV